MELTELKQPEKIAFINFGITNTMAGLLAMREAVPVRGAIKQKFELLWKQAKQLMNEVDREGERLHKAKMIQYKRAQKKIEGALSDVKLSSESVAILEQELLDLKQKEKYVPLSEGYDDFAEDLTIFLEAWLIARGENKTCELMQSIKEVVQ